VILYILKQAKLYMFRLTFIYYGTKGMKQQAKAPLYLMCNSMYNVVTRVYVVEKNEYLCLTDFFTQSVRFI